MMIAACKKDNTAVTSAADIVAGTYHGYVKESRVCPVGVFDSVSVYTDDVTVTLTGINDSNVSCSFAGLKNPVAPFLFWLEKESSSVVIMYKFQTEEEPGSNEAGVFSNGRLKLYPGKLIFEDSNMRPAYAAAGIYDCNMSRDETPLAGENKMALQVTAGPDGNNLVSLHFGASHFSYAALNGASFDVVTGALEAKAVSGTYKTSESADIVSCSVNLSGTFNISSKSFDIIAVFTPKDGITPASTFQIQSIYEYI